MSEKFVPCRVAQLPPSAWIKAAREAILSNPLNAPARPPALASMAPLSPLHMAALTDKKWPTSGVRLTVQFLDGPDAETRRKILAAANSWGTDPRGANVQFVETQGQGQVRVARTPRQGYYSYLGQDILHVPASECTMNLDSFTARTPDSEYNRVVKHEFGHTLSFPHEHTRKEIVGRIDPRKAEAYFLEYDGWDAQTVREQVLTALSDADLTALPADVLSIMCYNLPPEITVDGKPIPGGMDIDDEDFSLAVKLYPKSGTGGGGGDGGKPAGSRVFGLTFRQTVAPGQRVRIPVFAAPAEIMAGKYSVVGDAPAAAQEEDGVEVATAYP
jgi:hypothetical protein